MVEDYPGLPIQPSGTLLEERLEEDAWAQEQGRLARGNVSLAWLIPDICGQNLDVGFWGWRRRRGYWIMGISAWLTCDVDCGR